MRVIRTTVVAIATTILVVACSTTFAPQAASPSSEPPPSATASTIDRHAGDTMYIENRGGAPFDVYINDAYVLTVECGDFPTINPGRTGAAPLPWRLRLLRVAPKSWIFDQQVSDLPRWLEQLGGAAPFLSDKPVLGPVITCPPAPTATPMSSHTPDPYAGLPSNACGGFHLKIVNDRPGSVRVAMGPGWSILVDGNTTRTIVPMFESPRPQPEPWDVVITDEQSGQQLFRSTMSGPVDQKVTLSDVGAIQTPFDLMAEGC